MRFQIEIEKNLSSGTSRFQLNSRFRADCDRVVLFGPSGSGKSLTLRAMAGLLEPDRGRILVGGRLFTDTASGVHLPARKRRLGYLFQDYALFPHLTVRQNVAFGLRRMFSRITSAQRDRVDSLLVRFGLQDQAGMRPGDISGGQRQRTALARALAAEPEVLLLDEPFSALDQPLRERLRCELLALLKSTGLPMVMVTHDMDEVREFAECVVVYDQGRVRDVIRGRDATSRARLTESMRKVFAEAA